jgi:hypothetical protein
MMDGGGGDKKECDVSGQRDGTSSSSSSSSSASASGGGTVAVTFTGKDIGTGRVGQKLRSAILRNGATPHNGNAQVINCRGLGTCGGGPGQVESSCDP